MLRDFTKETFDIIIQAGQSNADGYGFGPAENPYTPDDRVYYLESDFTITLAAEKVSQNEIQSNFSLSFASEYIKSGKLEDGRKLLILRTAVGATGFCDNRWGMQDDLYLRMIEMTDVALKLNSNNRLVALLWHQGELDAGKKATFEQHYNNLMNLVVSVRNKFCVENLPFIAADFVQSWKTSYIESCTPVVDAVRTVCKDCKYGAFVETDGLPSNFEELQRETMGWIDKLHFSRNSLYKLGKRYFDCFMQITAE